MPTPNLALEPLASAQAQKHVTVNEAFARIDAATQMTVLDRDLSAPPTTPEDGDRYLIATGPTGAWETHENEIASWDDAAQKWLFFVPREGWRVWVTDESECLVYTSGTWQPLAPDTELNPVEGGMLGIHATADTTNRLAVASDAILMTHETDSVQLKLNKAASGNTASLLYQSAWSGRAEIGLAGDDDLHVKVSPDGSTFHEAMIVNRANGAVSFPSGSEPERHLPTSVTALGGADWWGPADPMTLCYSYGSGFTLDENHMYFASFYVPRPILLLGAFVSLYTASTTTGAVIRTGIYRVGAPNGTGWDIGARIADFGTDLADAAGNKIFDLSTPQTLDPGWYVTAWGVSGTGAKANYGRWLVPGTQRVYPYSSGTSARPRIAGHSHYLYDTASNTEITIGLPSSWGGNPIYDATSTNAWVNQCVFPKWRLP